MRSGMRNAHPFSGWAIFTLTAAARLILHSDARLVVPFRNILQRHGSAAKGALQYLLQPFSGRGEGIALSMEATFYPGIGADEEIAKLERLVGKITGSWAEAEDQLFTIFVFAVAGTWSVRDIEPYRAVFFSFNSYDSKMRMVHNAMRTRFRDDENTKTEWGELRKSMNDFSKLRNKIAHLIPRPKYSSNPNAKAVVRLAPPFWKPTEEIEFEKTGYSWDELTQALAPFWGFDPSLNILDKSHTRLSYRLHQFSKRLQPPSPS
jgi:hypothetical protein